MVSKRWWKIKKSTYIHSYKKLVKNLEFFPIYFKNEKWSCTKNLKDKKKIKTIKKWLFRAWIKSRLALIQKLTEKNIKMGERLIKINKIEKIKSKSCCRVSA